MVLIDIGVVFIVGLMVLFVMFVVKYNGVEIFFLFGELFNFDILVFIVLFVMFDIMGVVGVVIGIIFFFLMIIVVLIFFIFMLEVFVVCVVEEL